MTKQEVAKLLSVINAMWPNFKTDDKASLLEAWNFALSDYEYRAISESLKIYINTSGSSFAPSVAELIALTHKVDELSEMTEQDAWTLVRRAISRGYYYAKEEYDMLPPLVQKAVGAPEQLRNWAMTDLHAIDTVVASNFMKTYRTVANRQREMNMLPSDTRAKLASIQRLALEGGINGQE